MSSRRRDLNKQRFKRLETQMIQRLINAFLQNIRTVVAAGVRDAFRAGVADAVELLKDDFTLEYEARQSEEMDLEVLRIEDINPR